MVNTVTNTRVVAGETKVVQYITITSDGSEETDLVLYDSSAVATALRKVDPLDCKILHLTYSTNSLAGVVHLEFDANTDVDAWSCPAYSGASQFCFSSFGGIPNTSGAGRTGDITLTTTGLAAGDSISVVIIVDPSYA